MNQVVKVARACAEALVRAAGAPWRWFRTRVDRLRAPIDFEPV